MVVFFFWGGGVPLCLTTLKLAKLCLSTPLFTVKATHSHPFLQLSCASHPPSFPYQTKTFRVPGASFLSLHFMSLLLLYHFTINSVCCHCQISLLIVSCTFDEYNIVALVLERGRIIAKSFKLIQSQFQSLQSHVHTHFSTVTKYYCFSIFIFSLNFWLLGTLRILIMERALKNSTSYFYLSTNKTILMAEQPVF